MGRADHHYYTHTAWHNFIYIEIINNNYQFFPWPLNTMVITINAPTKICMQMICLRTVLFYICHEMNLDLCGHYDYSYQRYESE
jgi:hypothetical protein